ncbi:MAG: ribosome maturation factor RimP [Bacteriovoracaceae bacterium]
MDINRERTGLEKKFYLMCEPIVQESGYRLYDLEYISGQKLVRLYIQDPRTGSALIEDCVKVDSALSPAFETETWIPDEVILEVSSPGVYRNITTLEHFNMSLNEMVLVVIMGQLSDEQTVNAPKGIKGEKKFRGKLTQVSDENFVIEVKGYPLTLNYKQVKKINLDPDLKSDSE